MPPKTPKDDYELPISVGTPHVSFKHDAEKLRGFLFLIYELLWVCGISILSSSQFMKDFGVCAPSHLTEVPSKEALNTPSSCRCPCNVSMSEGIGFNHGFPIAKDSICTRFI